MPYVWRCQISYNGSGTFNINTTGQPVVTGTVISSTAFNALTADLGTGLSTALTKDGQTVATARIPFAQGINSSLVTDATSTTTGSIITAGGVGIAKALYVGTTANIAGTTTLAGVTATSITDSGLTSGRVTYAGTAGLLQDSANLTFNGTTLTANTIGAFTLGGTVAGGGNQLNNVIIGTTTPLAGAFTTLSANTGTFTTSSAIYGTTVNNTSNAQNYNALSIFQRQGVNKASFVLDSNDNFSVYHFGAAGVVTTVSSTGLAVTGAFSAQTTAGLFSVAAFGGSSVKLNSSGTMGYNVPTSFAHGWQINGVDAMILDASGNLGLGVTPSAWYTSYGTKAFQFAASGSLQGLDVSSSDRRVALANNDFINAGGNDIYINTGHATKYQQASGQHQWLNAPSGTAGDPITFTQAMTLDASGNLGIGTTAPLSLGAGYTTITVNNATNGGGIAFATGGVQKGEIFNGGNAMYLDCANSAGVINFRNTATGATMQFGSAGIVTMAAYGVGTATFSAAGVISSVSDETWKVKDGAPVDTDAMLNKLEPGYWYYNDEKRETFGKDRQLGFYAQNVNAAIGPEAAPEPETVTTKNDDGTETSVTKPWGYYDRSVLAVTVMSLQKALATIESLTARITALEAK